MKLLNRPFLPILLLVLSATFALSTQAQCKRFTKKNCLPSLAPFQHNGQLTSAVFNPGESADIEMTFNAGKQYRIVVCSQETLGKVQFKVLDKTRKVLYKSKENETSPSWDFKMTNTQQLTIQIIIPKLEEKNQITRLTPNGCVAILVGSK